MARYSRVQGPIADFDVGGSLAQIPGIAINRFWDDGELLILFSSTYTNASGAAALPFWRLFLDAIAISGNYVAPSIPNGGIYTMTGHLFTTLAQGPHAIALQAAGAAAANDFITANATQLTVIQLPLWDDPANLITL
jgi:hypothetical protein